MIKLNTKKYIKASIFLFFTVSLFKSYLIARPFTIEFHVSSNEMQCMGESILRDAIWKFKSNPAQSVTIEGISVFRSESDSIGLSRAETIRDYLIRSGINREDINVLDHKNGRCEILLAKYGSYRSSSTCERVTVNFWGSSTDMFGGENSKLRDVVHKFRFKGQNFLIEGKSAFTLESDDIGIRRAEIIKNFLMDSGINSRDIKIISTKNRECLILLHSR